MSNNNSAPPQAHESTVEAKIDETPDIGASDAGAQRERPKTKAVLKVLSFESLVDAVYDGSLTRVNFTKDETTAIDSGPLNISFQRHDVVGTALNDRTLSRSYQLLLIGTRWGNAAVASRIFELAIQVLKQHPVFKTEYLTAALNGQDLLAPEDAINRFTRQDFTSFELNDNGGQLSKAEIHRCKANGISSLLLFYWKTRSKSARWVLDQIQLIQANRSSRKGTTEVEKVHSLILTRDLDLVSSVYGLLQPEIADLRTDLEDARLRLQRSNELNNKLSVTLAEAESQLEESRSKARTLESELVQMRERYDTDTAHLRDDIEAIRGRVRARLNDEVTLLDEGLHALRRDPPKVHVMVDHAERAIDGLKREIKSLDREESK